MHWDFNPAHPTIWVFIALAIIIGTALKYGVHKTLGKSLDARADAIRKELDDAKALREEAQALLASYKRKQAEAEEQAKSIVEQARKDAENMAKQARIDLKERLDRRAEQAQAKIANAEAQAIADVKAKAVDLAAKAAEQLIRDQFKAADHNTLIKDGIADLGKALN
ncbi:MAG TPA: F0F1 ATP synthase subunit B [Hellea balneolensis]|uniref:ATP synthase subunit b n=1 Tax=Hellea balneolensis TaxID=287478 RepID=A0A7C3CBB2_9PROT|nr:F0F1 ATP synthase subunit B [Hellea balneolensis]